MKKYIVIVFILLFQIKSFTQNRIKIDSSYKDVCKLWRDSVQYRKDLVKIINIKQYLVGKNLCEILIDFGKHDEGTLINPIGIGSMLVYNYSCDYKLVKKKKVFTKCYNSFVLNFNEDRIFERASILIKEPG